MSQSRRRFAFPPLSRCEATIAREARWWAPTFRGALTVHDLRQEGWIVAIKCVKDFDPGRGVKIETYLTTSLRRHFARLVQTTLRKTLAHRNPLFVAQHPTSFPNPERAYEAKVLLARLTRSQIELVRDLADAGGSLSTLAYRRHVPAKTLKLQLNTVKRALQSGNSRS